MRHRKLKYKIGVDPGHRKALLRNLAGALIQYERIVTTHTRAKAVRRTAERLITWAKRGDLHARRQALKIIPQKKLVAKLFNVLAPYYVNRNGGYTRILKLAPRRGDAAPMVLMEWVGYEERLAAAEEKEKTEKTKKAKKSKAKEKPAPEQKAEADNTQASSSNIESEAEAKAEAEPESE
jgi:large subunit ribosomal protein L17